MPFSEWTAYFGIDRCASRSKAKTLLVTGAAVGGFRWSGQDWQDPGCRVVGIAGGADKCARAVVDHYLVLIAAIDYRRGRARADSGNRKLRGSADGVDIIWENVGGEILDAGITAINEHAGSCFAV